MLGCMASILKRIRDPPTYCKGNSNSRIRLPEPPLKLQSKATSTFNPPTLDLTHLPSLTTALRYSLGRFKMVSSEQEEIGKRVGLDYTQFAFSTDYLG
jgi:hypothetical protein